MSDASRRASGRSRCLPDLRHGARTENWCRWTTSRILEMIDMMRRFWIGLALTLPVVVIDDGGARRRASRSCLHPIPTGCCWRLRRRWWLGPVHRFSSRGFRSPRDAQSQHVHADCDGRAWPGSIALLPRSLRNGFPGVFVIITARSRYISRRRLSLPYLSCSARCWNCARAERTSGAIKYAARADAEDVHGV